MIKVLFVCMGNICRSPTAEAVFRHQVELAGLDGHIHIDSAGTHDYHIGDPPDARAQRAAKKRGYDMSSLCGRQVGCDDFQHFDLILAMDRHNLDLLQRQCPPEYATKLRLFMEFSENYDEMEVPDPYYGGGDGFERVLDLVEDAARGLLGELAAQRVQK
ncbi:MAG: low molecular weight protein-tyrosine-phosphatase [Pseudomonadota bacterium]